MKRGSLSVLLALGLAVVVHADWHLARPAHGHHRLSFGLPYHWVVAIPAFALAAWAVARLWPGRFAAASCWIVGTALVGAQLLEPLGEQIVYAHRLGMQIEPARWTAFWGCAAAGLAAYVATGFLLRGRRTRVPAGAAAGG